MNHVGLVGRITKDPELRYYNENRPYSIFTIAINRSFKNTQGNVEADFIQCVAWGRLAETISKHCGKGSMIGVNGRLNSKSYVNQENKRIYSIDVVAEDVRFYRLKPPSTEMDLSEFEQPIRKGPPDNVYDEHRQEESSNTKEVGHTIVAESTEKMDLPIPS